MSDRTQKRGGHGSERCENGYKNSRNGDGIFLN